MNSCLKEYLSIFEKYPKKTYLTKQQRKERHTLINMWRNKIFQELPSINELIEFIKEYKEEKIISKEFFEKLQSVWMKELDGYEFPKLLIEMDILEMLYGLNVNGFYVAEQVLRCNPNHRKALVYKFNILYNSHDFSLHELPWGVLVNGTLEEELRSVDEMEEMGEKLKIKNEYFKKLIDNCRFYYPLWFEYLSGSKKDNFESFLLSKGIDYWLNKENKN